MDDTQTNQTNPMSEYQALLEQQKALDAKLQEARKHAIADAVAKVRQIISDFDLTEKDVFGHGRSAVTSFRAGRAVAPKYRNPATGETWTGRGKPPRWIADQDRDQFLIPEAA